MGKQVNSFSMSLLLKTKSPAWILRRNPYSKRGQFIQFSILRMQGCNESLGYTDESYTEAVDSGVYTKFGYDSAGYGLAQWTTDGRKQGLQAFAIEHGTSISDLGMQLR